MIDTINITVKKNNSIIEITAAQCANEDFPKLFGFTHGNKGDWVIKCSGKYYLLTDHQFKTKFIYEYCKAFFPRWKGIYEGYNFMAMEKNGSLYLFSDEPVVDIALGTWKNYVKNSYSKYFTRIDTALVPDYFWMSSVWKRH